MCGFVGFYNHNNNKNHQDIISKMTDAIIHRGPDSSGYYLKENIALGFRRLAILDLSEQGNQPMIDNENQLAMVFNGEIYNYQEVREELRSKGYQFISNTDSEVVLRGYKEYGSAILEKLRGMFAFAIWDGQNEEIFIARDHFGIKPLYYSHNWVEGTFIFGSEIKSIIECPDFKRELNKAALRPYLTFQSPTEDETFFSGITKLKPGHYMIYQKGSLKINSFNRFNFEPSEKSMEESVSEIHDQVKSSVEYHRQSDVPLGAFLSGGIDSSYIVSLLKPDKTFSVGFEEYEDIFNETNHAKVLSNKLGIANYTKLLKAKECFDILPKIQYHMDEPQSNPSSVPLYFLAKLASEHVTVVLSGEGADELFGGYDWYQTSPYHLLYDKLPSGLRRALANLALKTGENRVSQFLVRGAKPLEEKFFGQAKVFAADEALDILKPDYRVGKAPLEITAPVFEQVKDASDLIKMQYLDMNVWLPGDILLKADKMSMAHSLELRVPFLDKEVMKTAAKLPDSHRVHYRDTKVALRKAALGVIPKEWAERKKVGFPVPIRHWLRQEEYYEKVKKSFETNTAKEFFDVDKLIKLLDDHYAGLNDNARKIWTVYVFLIWYQVYFDGEI